jgi:3-phenylpropionate/cinnamic acid dioxygenase small subunit
VDSADRMLIEWQLTTLSTRFAHFLDAGDFEAMIDLFTEDGVFDRGGVALRGHAEIRKAMAERPALTTRHLLTNHHFAQVDTDTARAIVSVVVFHGPVPENGGPVQYATEQGRVLEFHDRYCRTVDEWRIVERVARPIFQPKVWP